MKDKYYKADFFEREQKPRESRTLQRTDMFVASCESPKVRVTNTTLSNVFNMEGTDKKTQVRDNNSYRNTYKMGESGQSSNRRVRTSNTNHSSLFEKQSNQQQKVRDTNTNRSGLFQQKYTTAQFKRDDYVHPKVDYQGNQEPFKRRLREVYGKEGDLHQLSSNKNLQNKNDDQKTTHQKKIQDHYMNDVIGEQKKIDCEGKNQKGHRKLMEYNNEQRLINPEDQKQYHHQKKYHDLYSTYIINAQQKENSTNDLKKSKTKWIDTDHDHQRKKDQNYSNMFGKESQGKVRAIERTDDQTGKDNWQNREQKTDNSGRTFHSAFSNKQKELSSNILGKNYRNQFLQNRVSTPQSKKYFYEGQMRSGNREIKQNELRHTEAFAV